MGTPLLVSDVGGGPELVEDGCQGACWPPSARSVWAAAVGELLNDRAGARADGRARSRGHARIQRRKPILVPCYACMSSCSSRGSRIPLGLRRLCTSAQRGPFSHASLRACRARAGGCGRGQAPESRRGRPPAGWGGAVRILFVNHTSAWSGAEVSLMRLIEQLRHEHEICVACPPGGPLADDAGSRASDAPRPPRGGAQHAPPSVADAGRARSADGRRASRWAGPRRRFRPDVIHANSLRAGLMAVPATLAGSPPVVVRTHDRLPLEPAGPRRARGRGAQRRRGGGRVGLHGPPLQRRARSARGHPGVQRHRSRALRSRSRAGGAPARAARPRRRTRCCSARWPRSRPGRARTWRSALWRSCAATASTPTCSWWAGVAFAGKGVRYDNRAFLRSSGCLVDELGVRPAVHFLGQRDDVAEVLTCPRSLAAAVVGRALRAGYRGEHGPGYSSAGELHGRRSRGGSGWDHRPPARSAAPATPGRRPPRAATRIRRPGAHGRARTGRRLALSRRRARPGDGGRVRPRARAGQRRISPGREQREQVAAWPG